jgi:hypothetical protein
MSGNSEQEYFVDGMVEEIITRAFPHSLAAPHRPQFELHLQSDNAIVIKLSDITLFPSSLAFNLCLGYGSCARTCKRQKDSPGKGYLARVLSVTKASLPTDRRGR